MTMFSTMKNMMLGLGLSVGLMTVSIAGEASDFNLKDVDGKEVKLSEHKDKVVVLEWVNYSCPFVKKHYKGNHMQELQAKYQGKDVVWLSINSGPEDSKKGSHAPSEMKKVMESVSTKANYVLLDRDGSVGKAYGAKTTPHMVVINKGKVVYEGAIDSIKSADTADCDKADNYVAKALDSVLAGKSVETAKTQGYGCSVKY